jgi:D-glycero-alpha-D-manno-heptose 1-phosphate guanylyltransferase
MEISYVIEQQPLGTAGALRNAAPLIKRDHFLAMNGDTILDVDLQELLRLHTQRSALATVALWRTPEGPTRYGGVDLDEQSRIVRFSEKGQVFGGPPHPPPCGPPSPARERGTGAEGGVATSFINGGVYAFAREIFDVIPTPPASVSLEKDLFPSIVGERFYGFPCNGYFLDIGIPEDYEKAQKELPERFMLW